MSGPPSNRDILNRQEDELESTTSLEPHGSLQDISLSFDFSNQSHNQSQSQIQNIDENFFPLIEGIEEFFKFMEDWPRKLNELLSSFKDFSSEIEDIHLDQENIQQDLPLLVLIFYLLDREKFHDDFVSLSDKNKQLSRALKEFKKIDDPVLLRQISEKFVTPTRDEFEEKRNTLSRFESLSKEFLEKFYVNDSANDGFHFIKHFLNNFFDITNELDNKNKILESERQDLTVQLEQSSTRTNELDNKNKILESERQDLTVQLEQSSTRTNELDNKNKILESERQDLTVQLEQSSTRTNSSYVYIAIWIGFGLFLSFLLKKLNYFYSWRKNLRKI